jgi:hypothetical protein
LNCSRQAGKSTVCAILATHAMLYQAPALVLLLTPTLRQSQELFRRVSQVYAALDRPVPAEAESALRLELKNGSRLVVLPGREQTVRGYSGVDLLAIDEAARVPEELYASVRPMLAVSGGRLLALSTPFGSRGWWWEAWRGAEPWARWEVPATQCPRISPEFLAEEQRTIGEFWYRQEYCCQFSDAEASAFRREDVEACFAEPIETWDLPA